MQRRRGKVRKRRKGRSRRRRTTRTRRTRRRDRGMRMKRRACGEKPGARSEAQSSPLDARAVAPEVWTE